MYSGHHHVTTHTMSPYSSKPSSAMSPPAPSSSDSSISSSGRVGSCCSKFSHFLYVHNSVHGIPNDSQHWSAASPALQFDFFQEHTESSSMHFWAGSRSIQSMQRLFSFICQPWPTGDGIVGCCCRLSFKDGCQVVCTLDVFVQGSTVRWHWIFTPCHNGKHAVPSRIHLGTSTLPI